jgi:ketosteroid isomerase-like protein
MTTSALEPIMRALQDPAANLGELGFWADHVIYRRNGSDFDLMIRGEDRRRRLRDEREVLRRAMPDLQVRSTFHTDERSGVIIDVSRWSGTTIDVPGSAVAGDRYSYATCDVYTVRDRKIVRIDSFDDAAVARQWSELMTHTRLLGVR